MNRRSILAGSASLLVLAATLGATPAPGEFKPFVFLHAGDPEIGSPDLAGTAARFASLARRADAHGAAFVIVSGDVTHDSSAEQWEAVRKALRQFKVPVHMVPGNHDFESARKRADFRREIGAEHYVFTHNDCDFVCANSNLLPCEQGRLWASDADLPGDARAESRAHRKWIEEALRESQQRRRTHRFLVLHHPLVEQPPVAGRMAELLTETGVQAVLCGHRHVTAEFSGKGFVVYLTPGTAKLKSRDPVRDRLGLGYRVFKGSRDQIEQEFVPLSSEIAPPDAAP
jgi:serine/threonine-protein phosphatase CPPED1